MRDTCRKISLHIGLSILWIGIVTPVLAQEKQREKAFAFELKDTLGQVVTLEDFAEKTIVVDFWFTGCRGCVQVAKALHERIIPAFANDSNVVFVSVCLDINFLQWKRSLKTGLYTSKEQINLFTRGMGSAHPLFKHYRYSGCPQLLLIDKEASLITSSPPIPIPGNTNSINEFISLIRNNL